MKKCFSCIFFLFMACNTNESIMKTTDTLEGTWTLNYITGPRIAFDGLYPKKKPTITFDLKENTVSGNNSCNQYFGVLKVVGNKINFKDSKMGTTLMACLDNQGDIIYMKTLEQIDSFSISADGKILKFIMGNVTMMRFQKK